VSVTAKDKATGKEQQIRIQASGGLSDADIQKMVKDAEANAAEDKKRRELVEARNAGEAMIHSTEKSVKEFGDKVDAGDKTAIETAMADLKTALEGDDIEAIKAKSNDLMQASMKLGEAMYKAQQAAETEAAEADAAKHAAKDAKKDDVIDADFKDVSDSDKKKSA
ncbi:MAG: Hsp70 family protein, partial [Beijerinckiaceae bacterium]